jgi:transcriptional regulator with XRE-family HTH domain
MVPSFGGRLRAERERKQIALTDIAEDTKIKVSLLEGLERDDLSWWPGGLFRRAYVRAYARAIGLDPETVVREFLEKYPEPVEPEADAGATPARTLLTSPITAVSALLRRGRVTEPAANAMAVGPPAAAGDTPVDPPPGEAPAHPQPDVLAISSLCTRLGRLSDRRGLRALLGDAARALDAVGVIVWSWDPAGATLRPSLADGYSEALLAQLPRVPADADNAVAAAFRSRETCVVRGGPGLTGAVAAPLIGPGGCVGVLAIEVHDGCEQQESVRAFVAILAAQLAGLVGPVALAEAVA